MGFVTAELPDVLPTERLTGKGRPRPELRAGLRRIPDARNSLTVIGAWLQSVGVVLGAVAIGRWWAYLVAFALAGRGHALLSVLAHEAAHKLLFSNRRLNDAVGRWLLAYPALTSFDLYRRAHLAHHRDPLGDDEPDAALYSGYPITRASMRRKLLRDALFVSASKVLRPLVRGLADSDRRKYALPIVSVQAVLAVAFTAIGGWWVYPLLWLAPWMTVWRVLNRLRALAEHAGMTASDDTRLTTHVVRQRLAARFWLVPYNTGWHLAHHVDMGIPFRNLPALHRELESSGWLPPPLRWPSYTALWRALSSLP